MPQGRCGLPRLDDSGQLSQPAVCEPRVLPAADSPRQDDLEPLTAPAQPGAEVPVRSSVPVALPVVPEGPG